MQIDNECSHMIYLEQQQNVQQQLKQSIVCQTTFCPEICDCQNLWILKQTGTLLVLCENVPQKPFVSLFSFTGGLQSWISLNFLLDICVYLDIYTYVYLELDKSLIDIAKNIVTYIAYIGCPKEKCGFFQISFFSLVVVVVCWCTHFSSSFFFSSKKLRGKNCCIAVSTAAFFVRLSGNGIFFSCLSVFFLTQSPRQNLTSE